MGLEEKKKKQCSKLSEKELKEYYVDMLTKVLETNISVFAFYKRLANDEKSIETAQKCIDNSKKGIDKIKGIKHIAILESLYAHIIVGKEQYYAMSGSLCSYDKIDVWDKTTTGYRQFLKMEKEGMELALKKQQEAQKNKEIIDKAKQEGKKVDMIYDEKTKSLKPVVVEEKPNA